MVAMLLIFLLWAWLDVPGLALGSAGWLERRSLLHAQRQRPNDHSDDGIATAPQQQQQSQSLRPGHCAGNENAGIKLQPMWQLEPRSLQAPGWSYITVSGSSGDMYHGVWGYTDPSGYEYCLFTHSWGLYVYNCSSPATTRPALLWTLAMPGGRIHRDLDVHKHMLYVAGQEGSNLYIVDLSPLHSGQDPIYQLRLGFQDFGHTVHTREGLLYLNTAGGQGCRVCEVESDPWLNNPVCKTFKTNSDCHDSFHRGTDLYVADGYKSRYSKVDFSSFNSIDQTIAVVDSTTSIGAYAHSLHVSEDSTLLATFEESNIQDILLFDTSDMSKYTTPLFNGEIHWAGEPGMSALVHNGQIQGDLLHVAYYEAGYRIFDISPLKKNGRPIEVAYYDTWRDADGDGLNCKAVNGYYDGAWNVYTDFVSGNVLVTDMRAGLFIFPPFPQPSTIPASASFSSGQHYQWSRYCGDGICQRDLDEDCSHCMEDCPVCLQLSPATCLDDFCQNGGTCEPSIRVDNNANTIACQCPPGITGAFCQMLPSPSSSPSRSSTPSTSLSSSPSSSRSQTPSTSLSSTSSSSRSQTPSMSLSSTSSSTRSQTPSISSSTSPSPSVSISATPSPSSTPSRTASQTISLSATPSPSSTSSSSLSLSSSKTSSISVSSSVSITSSPSLSASHSMSPSHSLSLTPTLSVTSSLSSTTSITPSSSKSVSVSMSKSHSPSSFSPSASAPPGLGQQSDQAREFPPGQQNNQGKFSAGAIVGVVMAVFLLLGCFYYVYDLVFGGLHQTAPRRSQSRNPLQVPHSSSSQRQLDEDIELPRLVSIGSAPNSPSRLADTAGGPSSPSKMTSTDADVLNSPSQNTL